MQRTTQAIRNTGACQISQRYHCRHYCLAGLCTEYLTTCTIENTPAIDGSRVACEQLDHVRRLESERVEAESVGSMDLGPLPHQEHTHHHFRLEGVLATQLVQFLLHL